LTSVLPGNATVLDIPPTIVFDEQGNQVDLILYELPLVIFGTNFDPKAEVVTSLPSDDGMFSPANEVISSSQIVFRIQIKNNPLPVGTWAVWVKNPQPGGGVSEPIYFQITQNTFVANPFITSIDPDTVTAGGQPFTLTVNGTNFQTGSQIIFYSSPLPTSFVSTNQLTAEIPAALIMAAGKKPITVANPDNGGTSNKVFLEVQ
jgi:hypothetical protein